MNGIADKTNLGQLYGEPSERAVLKQLDHLDKHCRAFIEISPFLVIGTMGSDGLGDVSPRGDAPGFVKVRDEKTIYLPDRLGNNRTDTLLNDVRQFTISNEIITMGYSKLSKRDDRTWRRVIKVICEMNDNNWSPCGSIYGEVRIKQKGNSYTGVLDIPYDWSTNGNVRIVDLQYSCTK